MTKERKDYRVGYKKPPVHTRFRKGVSGNPAGRPRELRNLKTDFLEELSERVTVTEGGKRRHHSKQRVTIKALVNKAMTGDVRAAAKVIEYQIKLFGLDEAASGELGLSQTDQEILAAFLERYGGSQP